MGNFIKKTIFLFPLCTDSAKIKSAKGAKIRRKASIYSWGLLVKASTTNCQDFLKHLGEEMVQSGLITSDQLAVARVTQDSMGGNIGNILLKKGFVGEDQITNFLSGRLNIPLQSIKGLSIDTNLVRLIPYTLAYRYSMLPLTKCENKIQLALADPLSLYSLDEISNTLHCEVEVVLAPKEEVLSAMREHYRKQDLREIDIDEVEVIKETDENQDENTEKVQEMASSVGAVSSVNSIFVVSSLYFCINIFVKNSA